MEVDRINLVRKPIKVERAGSEQERRKRGQQELEFAEVLEDSITEDQDERDTAEGQSPATEDRVTLSSEGKVSAEVLQAQGSTLRLSLAQQVALGLLKGETRKDEKKRSAPNKQSKDGDTGQIDTIA